MGCKLYIPDERTRKYVPDIRVNENVLYRHRPTTEYAEPGTVDLGDVPIEEGDSGVDEDEDVPSKINDVRDSDSDAPSDAPVDD